jgi:hypothetical protein
MDKYKIYFTKEKGVTEAVVSHPSFNHEKGLCILDTLEGGREKLSKMGVDTTLLDNLIASK